VSFLVVGALRSASSGLDIITGFRSIWRWHSKWPGETPLPRKFNVICHAARPSVARWIVVRCGRYLWRIAIRRICCVLCSRIIRPPWAEAFSRPSAQPVTTQRCVRVRIIRQKCVMNSFCPVYFRSPGHIARPQHWPSRLNRPNQVGSQ